MDEPSIPIPKIMLKPLLKELVNIKLIEKTKPNIFSWLQSILDTDIFDCLS